MMFVATARQVSRAVSRSRLCVSASPLLTNTLSQQPWTRAVTAPFLPGSGVSGAVRTKVSDQEEAREMARMEAEAAAILGGQVAPEYNPEDSGTTTENASIENLLSSLNEVFEIIAAVPLMDEEQYGELRDHYERGPGLDEFDERGYSIKVGTLSIWKGERDLKKLTEGVDADSAQILERILLHTLNIERKVRAMLVNGGVDPDDVNEPEEGSKTT